MKECDAIKRVRYTRRKEREGEIDIKEIK